MVNDRVPTPTFVAHCLALGWCGGAFGVSRGGYAQAKIKPAMRREIGHFRSRHRLAVKRDPDYFSGSDRSDGQVQRHGGKPAATVGLVQNPAQGVTAME
jgi:hypothetical protein